MYKEYDMISKRGIPVLLSEEMRRCKISAQSYPKDLEFALLSVQDAKLQQQQQQQQPFRIRCL